MPDDATTTATPATAPGDPATTATTTTDAKTDEPLGEAGEAALKAERAARKAAEKRLRDLEAAEQKRADEQRKADEDAAAKAGEWEKLAAKRETERDEAKREATSLQGQIDQYRAAIDGLLTDEWKGLPAEVRDAYLGADDDPLAKLAFLPKAKKLAAKLAEKDPAARGNGPDPKGTGSGLPSVADTANEYRRMLRVR